MIILEIGLRRGNVVSCRAIDASTGEVSKQAPIVDITWRSKQNLSGELSITLRGHLAGFPATYQIVLFDTEEA